MINISSKQVVALLLFIVSSFTLNAQTNVSGFISANTTWTTSGSPYIIVGNTLVSHGYTLKIEPFVVVKFDTNKVLQIDGVLDASGAYDGRITFTSNQPNPAPGDWGEIHFADTCEDAVFDTSGRYLSGCIMRYCDVQYGGSLGLGEIDIAHSSPYFSHCNFLKSQSDGIYCSGGNYIMDTSAVKNCMGSGLYFNFPTYVENSFCSLIVRSDTIEGNMKHGVYFHFVESTLCPNHTFKILNNYFVSNQQETIYTDNNYLGADHLTIAGNYFYNNKGQSVIYYDDGINNYVISCNKFINNTTTTYGVIHCNISTNGFISYNLFDGNTATSGPSISTIRVGGGYMYFNNNIIQNNISTNNACSVFWPNVFPDADWRVDHNTFSNNTGLTAIQISGGSFNPGNLIYLKFNNLMDTKCKYEIYNQVAYGYSDLYADSNFWGTTSIQHIDSAIYDFFDYGNMSVVYYQPPLAAPAFVDTSCSYSFPSAIKTIDEPIHSNAYPNPFSTGTEVMFGKELKDGEVMIYNVFGQRMRVMEHVHGDRVSIERGNLCSGVYIYEVLEKQGRVGNGKLVVE